VVQVPGNHSLRTDLPAVAAVVREWLKSVVVEERAAPLVT
jgi:hypothetical protein